MKQTKKQPLREHNHTASHYAIVFGSDPHLNTVS